MYRTDKKNIIKELKRKYNKTEVKQLLETIEKALLNNEEKFIIDYKGYIYITKKYSIAKDRFKTVIEIR